MKQNRQREILLGIYSIDYLLRCELIESSGNTIKLTPRSGKLDMFQLYDPVVLINYNNGELETFPADVCEIDGLNNDVTILIREIEVREERRVFERYPVSLAVSARRKFSNKRLHLLVKDISLYGMGVVSEADLDEEELIDIDLITDRVMFYFGGKIIWKKRLDQISEYGLQITEYDVTTRRSFEDFLMRQKERYLNMISKAR